MRLQLPGPQSAVLIAMLFVIPAAGQRRSPRQLSPGTMTIIPATPTAGETFTAPRPLRGFTGKVVDEETGKQFVPNFQPQSDVLFESTKRIIFRRPVWQLEFAFKTLRMIEVNMPNPVTKKYQKKLIWYMVYRVTNRGNALKPSENADGTFTATPVKTLDSDQLAFRFFPHFVLQGWVHDPRTKTYHEREYLDQIVPSAVEMIRDDEVIPRTATTIYYEENGQGRKVLNADKRGKPLLDDHGRPVNLLNTVQMSQLKIPLSTEGDERSVWGVAVWEDVNPKIDYVTVYVRGLTNAFRYIDFPDPDSPMGARREFVRRTLQINFWRPGDAYEEEKDTILYGVPLVNSTFDQLDLVRRYQLPGPVIAVYEYDNLTGHEVKLFEVESPLNNLLDPTLQFELDGRVGRGPKLPKSIEAQFRVRGIILPPRTVPSIRVRGLWWEIGATVGGRAKTYRLMFEPKYWIKDTQGKVEIREDIDHLWLYRPRHPELAKKKLGL